MRSVFQLESYIQEIEKENSNGIDSCIEVETDELERIDVESRVYEVDYCGCFVRNVKTGEMIQYEMID